MKKDYSPQNMLVTGGAGFIGANFILYLASRHAGINIINLDSLTYAGSVARLDALPDTANYHFVEGDIADDQLVAKLLRDYSIDTIVHFAAESHVDRSIDDPSVFVKTNVLGTWNLLHCAKQYWLEEKQLTHAKCRFHHISTDEVYGSLETDAAAFTESHAYLPSSPYSASKAGSDHMVRSYSHTFGLPITVSNCSNNYGPGQHTEKLIPTIIAACATQKPIPIYGEGKNIRDWLYVDDHCAGIDAIIRGGALGETYNIGDSNEWSNLQIAHEICAIFDQLSPKNKPHADLIQFVDDRLGHDWRYAIDHSKIKNQLGWEAQMPFQDGLRKTIESYQK